MNTLEKWLKYGVKTADYYETTKADLLLCRNVRFSVPTISVLLMEIEKVGKRVAR